MPKAKKTSEIKSEKKIAPARGKTGNSEKKPKAKTKSLVKKKTVVLKKTAPTERDDNYKKKIKSVIVDVIKDEDDVFPDLPSVYSFHENRDLTSNNDDSDEGQGEDDEDNNESHDDYKTQKTSGLDCSDDVRENMSAEASNSERKKEEDIDKQKLFYSQLVSEIKTKDVSNIENSAPSAKHISLYRGLVWKFLSFTVVLLLVVLYFSFATLTIVISPKGEEINDSFLLKIESGKTDNSGTLSETDYRELIPGEIKEVFLNDEKIVTSSGEEFIGDEIYGQVTLVNNSNKPQVLVAKTRLLSTDNKLYRLKEGVTIPAGGKVETEIYSDIANEDMAINASTFTIPGLWLGLQDKIFAKSEKPFVYRQKVKKYIKASDIEQATSEMNNSLVSKLKEKGGKVSSDQVFLHENLDNSSVLSDGKAGESKESFTVRASSSLVSVVFSKSDVSKLAAAKLSLLVPDDKELVDYSQDNIKYSLDQYDVETGVATVKATFTGTMVLKSDANILDKKQLVNLSQQQLENYLKTFPEIRSYKLKFNPSFITRAPRLPEKIHVQVAGLEK